MFWDLNKARETRERRGDWVHLGSVTRAPQRNLRKSLAFGLLRDGSGNLRKCKASVNKKSCFPRTIVDAYSYPADSDSLRALAWGLP